MIRRAFGRLSAAVPQVQRFRGSKVQRLKSLVFLSSKEEWDLLRLDLEQSTLMMCLSAWKNPCYNPQFHRDTFWPTSTIGEKKKNNLDPRTVNTEPSLKEPSGRLRGDGRRSRGFPPSLHFGNSQTEDYDQWCTVIEMLTEPKTGAEIKADLTGDSLSPLILLAEVHGNRTHLSRF